MKTQLFPSLVLLFALTASVICCSSASGTPAVKGNAAGASSGASTEVGAAGQSDSSTGGSASIGDPSGY